MSPTSTRRARQIGHKESMKDTARVLGRMFDAIEFRGSGQGIVEDLAKYAGVPVYNGLTDDWHPTQMLADMLTMVEHSDKPRTQIAYAFLGDARNNMGNSLLVARRDDGLRRAHGGAEGEPAARRRAGDREEMGRRDRRAADGHRRHRQGREGRRLRPHRRLGVDGRGQGGLGRADQAAHALPGQHGADEEDRQPDGQVHALPAGLPQHRDQGRQGDRSRSSASPRWRSPRRCSRAR